MEGPAGEEDEHKSATDVSDSEDEKPVPGLSGLQLVAELTEYEDEAKVCAAQVDEPL